MSVRKHIFFFGLVSLLFFQLPALADQESEVARITLRKNVKKNPIKKYKEHLEVSASVESDKGKRQEICQSPSFFREFFKENLNKISDEASKFIREKLQAPDTHRMALTFLIKRSTHYMCLYWGGYQPQDMSEFWDLYNAADLISKNGK